MELKVQNFGHLIGKYGLYILQDKKEKEQILNDICPFQISQERDIIIFVLENLFKKQLFERIINKEISNQLFSQIIIEYYDRILNTKIKHTQSQISVETNKDEIKHLNEKLNIINKARNTTEPIIGNLITMYKNYKK